MPTPKPIQPKPRGPKKSTPPPAKILNPEPTKKPKVKI